MLAAFTAFTTVSSFTIATLVKYVRRFNASIDTIVAFVCKEATKEEAIAAIVQIAANNNGDEIPQNQVQDETGSHDENNNNVGGNVYLDANNNQLNSLGNAPKKNGNANARPKLNGNAKANSNAKTNGNAKAGNDNPKANARSNSNATGNAKANANAKADAKAN